MTAVSSASSLSAMAENAVPMLPTAYERLPAALSMASMSMTAVVLPLVPVTAICSARQNDEASSSSLITRLPSRRASSTTSLVGGTPGLSTMRSQSANTRFEEVAWLFEGSSS